MSTLTKLLAAIWVTRSVANSLEREERRQEKEQEQLVAEHYKQLNKQVQTFMRVIDKYTIKLLRVLSGC